MTDPVADWRLESEHHAVLVDRPIPRNDSINMAQAELEDKGIWAKKTTVGGPVLEAVPPTIASAGREDDIGRPQM
jgi:hypothetical protein